MNDRHMIDGVTAVANAQRPRGCKGGSQSSRAKMVPRRARLATTTSLSAAIEFGSASSPPLTRETGPNPALVDLTGRGPGPAVICGDPVEGRPDRLLPFRGAVLAGGNQYVHGTVCSYGRTGLVPAFSFGAQLTGSANVFPPSSEAASMARFLVSPSCSHQFIQVTYT